MMRGKRSLRSPTAQRGFTLLELLTAIVVAGVLASLAMPDVRVYLEQGRLRSVSNDLVSDLRYARSEAITQNIDITLAGTGGNLSDGWQVSCGVSTVCSNAMRQRAATRDVTVTAAGALSFGPDGRPTAGAVQAFVRPAVSSGALRQRCIDIGLNGRVSVVVDRDNDMTNGC